MILAGKQLVWKNYQKEIADDNYFYVRSCVRQNFFPGSETTFIRILKDELHKDIYENPHHTTCTGIGYHGDVVPLETTMTVVARQFALMTEAGYENLVPSCVTSFGLYTEILDTWHHFPEVENKIREYLYKATKRTFEIPKNLAHASDIIYKFKDEILTRAKYKLINQATGEPLKIVDHIGCHYSKMFPNKGVGGAEFPLVLEGLVESWGGVTVDYPERRQCCGFGFRQYLIKANRSYSVSCSYKKFESMVPYKPDLIITNCPGCPMFLDKWQYVLGESHGKTYGSDNKGIPVLTFEELAGLVLGYNPWELGLQLHQVDCEPLLKKMGYNYEPKEKYLGKDNKPIGRKEPAVIL